MKLAEEEYQFPRDVCGYSFAERDGFQVLGGIVDDHQDVFVALIGLGKWPYKIHAHLFQRDPNDGKGD